VNNHRLFTFTFLGKWNLSVLSVVEVDAIVYSLAPKK
jgi:hypothetical protein